MRRLLDDVGSVLTLAVICWLTALLLREKAPRTWPRSLLWLGAVAAVGAVAAIGGGGSTNLIRFFAQDKEMVLGTLVVAALITAVLRARRWTWARSVWFGGCALLIGWTTLPSPSGPPQLSPDPRGELVKCVSDPWRWRPPRLSHGAGQFVSEFLPNIALFVPLGVGLLLVLSDRPVAATRRGRALLVLGPFLLSCAVESYQALFTTRVCAPIDVMSNTAGALVGAALTALTLRALRRPGRG